MAPPRRGVHHGAMIKARTPSGTTLLELVFALLLLSILLGVAVPPLREGRDRLAVQGARDALATGVAHARVVAIARGGAVVVIEPAAARFRVETPDGGLAGEVVDLATQYGVRLEVPGDDVDEIALRFDARGIGRVVNRTFVFRRGRAEAGLTLSVYGRARRW